MCWRIVRIAGDGSIKLILDNQTTTCKEANGTVNNSIGSGNFGNDESTYSNKIILNYLSPKTDAEKSMVNAFETFQKNKLSKYLDNLKSGDWCYQDAVYNGNTLLTEDDKANLYKKGTSFNYDVYNRLWNSTPVKITNKCNGTILTKYSDNTDMYVATLTADEVAYAGGHANNKGTYFHGRYAGKTYISYEGWLLSPANWSASIPGPFILYNLSTGFGTNPASSQYGGNKNFVPSIQLKANTLISKGTGTISDPYEIK